MFKTGIGQDSHRIIAPAQGRPLILGGLVIAADFALEGNSDSDVILHAITNAISGITCKPILGPIADGLCRAGITDSRAYLAQALSDLAMTDYRLTHVSVTVECKRPKLLPHFPAMKAHLESLLNLDPGDIALTATSGEGLSDFGRGDGMMAFAVASAVNVKWLPR